MQYKVLTDFCDINMGQSPDSESYNDKKDGMPFYQGNADFGPIHPLTRVWCSSPIKVAHTDDILISVRAPIGALNIANEECCIGRGLASLSPKKNNTFTKFLFYALKSKSEELNYKGTGSTFKAISKKILEETLLPYYSLSDQHKIVTTLDRVNDLISLRNQQLEQLDLLVKSRFVEMFGDPVKNEKGWIIKELQSISKVGSSKRFYQEELCNSGVPFLKIADILNKIDNKITEISTYISEEQYAELLKQNLVPKENDVLVTSRGTIGKCYIISKDDKFYFQDGMITWLSNFDKYLSPIFIYYSFMMNGIRNQINIMQAGSTVAYLSIAMIKKLNIIVPPLALQNQFADFVQQVDKAKASIKQSLEQLETLKKKLMQDYFG